MQKRGTKIKQIIITTLRHFPLIGMVEQREKIWGCSSSPGEVEPDQDLSSEGQTLPGWNLNLYAQYGIGGRQKEAGEQNHITYHFQVRGFQVGN